VRARFFASLSKNSKHLASGKHSIACAFLATPIQVARVRASPRQLPTRRAQHESSLRTRTRLPCTPVLAPSKRNSGRARSPARARPTPCQATQGTAPPTSAPTRAPIPRTSTAGATPCHPYRVSLPPITIRSPSPFHRSEQAKASTKGKPRHADLRQDAEWKDHHAQCRAL
jgi:hypothetical protein